MKTRQAPKIINQITTSIKELVYQVRDIHYPICTYIITISDYKENPTIMQQISQKYTQFKPQKEYLKPTRGSKLPKKKTSLLSKFFSWGNSNKTMTEKSGILSMKKDTRSSKMRASYIPNLSDYRSSKFSVKGLKSKKTLGKSSLFSKSAIRKEYMESSHHISKFRNIFDAHKINVDKFNIWVSNNLRRWLAFNLFPQIIDKNIDNLKKINEALKPFGKKLQEIDLFLKYSDMLSSSPFENQFSPEDNFRFPSSNFQNTKFSYISHNQFNNIYSSNNAYSSTNNKPTEIETLEPLSIQKLIHVDISYLTISKNKQSKIFFLDEKNLNKALEKLAILIKERIFLDNFLKTDRHSIELTRRYIFKRMCFLSKDNFNAEWEKNEQFERKDLPNDQEIILETFIKFLMQHDPYYKRVDVSGIVIEEPPMWKFSDKDFYILVIIN